MTDDTQKAQEQPVTDTQEPAMPTGEQKQDVSQPEVAVPQGETPQQATDAGLPEGASERTTREFDKLRNQLREERKRREQIESAFQTLQPKAETPNLIDESGYINEQALQQTQKAALESQRRVEALEDQLREEKLNAEEKELYQSYPELNSEVKDKFDKDFFTQARRVWYDSMVNPDDYGGKQLSWKEAADLAKGNINVEQARREGAEAALQELTPKEQASLEAAGIPSERVAGMGLDELQRRSRKGDQDAIVARLKSVKQE